MRFLLFSATLLTLAGCATTPRPEMTRPFTGYLPSLAKGITPPTIQTAAKPIYPRAALRQGIQGCAWIKFDISNTGNPVNLRIVSSVPVANFGQSAMAALRKWRFVPAKKENGQPIVVEDVVQQFKFKLSPRASTAYHVKVQAMPSDCRYSLPSGQDGPA